MTEIQARLNEIKGLGLYRRTRLVSGPQGPNVVLDGRPVLLLCSNNYLGLADHERVQEAAAEAAMRWGVGAGSSRLVSGTMTIHSRLEQKLADFKGTESALLFGSGYLANLGVIGALARPGEVVFSDELNHASIIDGCRLSRAEVFVYAHNDMEHLAWGLAQAGPRAALIVTESIFSMDGDVAPLEEISELGQDHDVRVVVDEAHATGCHGPGGRGAVAEAGLEGEIDVVVGTLGKALGSYGAFAACDAETTKLLTNTARPFIFSTAPPPPAIAGALAALDVLIEQPRRVERLQANAEVLRGELAREGFDVSGSCTQIVPLIVGEAFDGAARLRGGARARRLRPGDPPADGARGHLAPAPDGDVDAHQGRAARRRSRARPRGAAGRLPARDGDARGGRARGLARRCAGVRAVRRRGARYAAGHDPPGVARGVAPGRCTDPRLLRHRNRHRRWQDVRDGRAVRGDRRRG